MTNTKQKFSENCSIIPIMENQFQILQSIENTFNMAQFEKLINQQEFPIQLIMS